MEYFQRAIERPLLAALKRKKSVLLLGARQTGKTTLINRLLSDRIISFIQPAIRQRYEQNPNLLIGEIEALAEDKGYCPLVIIDEVQKVPEILDAIQDLIDRKIAQFILTGSSARKLKKGAKVNLLPGRVVSLKLDSLMLGELIDQKFTLEDFLLYGSLPGILTVSETQDKEVDLTSYVTTYLEEEIRSEAVVRNIGAFSRFLALAASESGNIINFAKLSQEIGISHTTITAYYQILEDCLIAERIDPIIKTKTRRRLIRGSKYLFFDLGVRRVSAEEGIKLPQEYLGRLFEQWIGLELIRFSHLSIHPIKVNFWRDANGPEVDWVVSTPEHCVPIEVKWTENPTEADAKHLKLFKNEYDHVQEAFIICRTPRKIKLAEGIYALPWQEMEHLFHLFKDEA
jgi:predicted AAA+ superfamily ATPase